MCTGKRNVVIRVEISRSDFDFEAWERNDVVDRVDDGLPAWDREWSVDEIMLHVDDDESRDESRYRVAINGYGYCSTHDGCRLKRNNDIIADVQLETHKIVKQMEV